MLLGNLRKYCCIPFGVLGKSMVLNILKEKLETKYYNGMTFIQSTNNKLKIVNG